MRTVKRFVLPMRYGFVKIEMPFAAKILSLAIVDNEFLMLWALVETDNADVSVSFHIAASGDELPHAATEENYVGTVRLPGALGQYVSVFRVWDGKVKGTAAKKGRAR